MNLYLRLLRVLLQILLAPRRPVLHESRLRFRVMPHDCDLNLHVNNGRYLTLMDLGRVHLMGQTGMLAKVLRRRWLPLVAAVEITFIRALSPFQRFELVTRAVTWDEKYFYLEQRFESGGRLCALSLVKAVFFRDGARIAPRQVLQAAGADPAPPPMPALVRHWAEMSLVKREHSGRS